MEKHAPLIKYNLCLFRKGNLDKVRTHVKKRQSFRVILLKNRFAITLYNRKKYESRGYPRIRAKK